MWFIPSSYQILAPAQMQQEKDVKKAAGVCLEVVGLDAELYRLGNTKARWSFPFLFRAFHRNEKLMRSWKQFVDLCFFSLTKKPLLKSKGMPVMSMSFVDSTC